MGKWIAANHANHTNFFVGSPDFCLALTGISGVREVLG
jgi:hypothetical protein